jgi:hypothetical protein
MERKQVLLVLAAAAASLIVPDTASAKEAAKSVF